MECGLIWHAALPTVPVGAWPAPILTLCLLVLLAALGRARARARGRGALWTARRMPIRATCWWAGAASLVALIQQSGGASAPATLVLQLVLAGALAAFLYAGARLAATGQVGPQCESCGFASVECRVCPECGDMGERALKHDIASRSMAALGFGACATLLVILVVPLPLFCKSSGGGRVVEAIPGNGVLAVDGRSWHVVGETIAGSRPHWAQGILPSVHSHGGTNVVEFLIQFQPHPAVLYATDQWVCLPGVGRQPCSIEGIELLLDHPHEAAAARAVMTFPNRVLGPMTPSTNPADMEWTLWALALVAGALAASIGVGWML